MGVATPVYCRDVLHGDTFQHRVSALIRCSPILAPLMHPVKITFDTWFVPNRLVFPEWESFITGGEDGLDATTWPNVTTAATKGDFWDYCGVPTNGQQYQLSTLPLMAYNLIHNEGYRDQQLQAERTETDSTLFNVAWARDYLTMARPQPQLRGGS